MHCELKKHNKLCGQMRIAALYKEGKRFTSWPLRVTYKPITSSDPISPSERGAEGVSQVLVWAPKSLFKRAVKRNHLRRLMREAYRLHQDLLGETHYLVAFNYMDKEEQSFAIVEKAVVKALKKITSDGK